MTNETTDAPLGPDEAAAHAAAMEILRRHAELQHEDNIRGAIRDFLVATRLAKSEEIVYEEHPALGSRKAVDLSALDTFIECKNRIGLDRGFKPDSRNVDQLDEYLDLSQGQGRVRMGILTDGKNWLLRWPGAGEIRTGKPYGFVLESADKWVLLYEWLRDEALVALENIPPTRSDIEKYFGIKSPRYLQDIDTLTALYERARDNESIAVKRRLWQDLLRTALGEIAQGEAAMDDLFIRHTYLTTVIGIVVQASFGIDIRGLAETRPDDLVLGQKFRSDTGLEGVVESDFFAWPTEVGADSFLKQLARRINRFDWPKAPTDVAAILYETVIPPAERRQLGEYYTPHWLARAMVREIVTDPLNQRVLDPACGSGTFLAEAITHFIDAADNNSDSLDTYTASELLNQLRERVIGIDVHPVAVHLARAAWVLAAKPLFDRARDERGSKSSTRSAPVYLGDSLQLRFSTPKLHGGEDDDVKIQVGDDGNTELIFPVSLVSRAENFDQVIADVTSAIESGDDPMFVLDEAGVFEHERPALRQTFAELQRLHAEGRDHIWAYYTRNMVRPVALAQQKVDVIIGNPPWINYNKTVSDLRSGLEQLSKTMYGIWQGGRYATHQDVAGLFYTRSVDLYLKDGGVIGMVMPHSALQTGQYARWRMGLWQPMRGGAAQGGAVLAADFTFKPAWDLERLQPNTFFPVPASVVFARRVGRDPDAPGKALAGRVERWIGKAGADDVIRESVTITDTSAASESPYARQSRNGATIFPRVLFFVEEAENRAVIQASGTVMVNPRRGSQDKSPWRDLDLTEITGQTIETAHIFDVHLGETLVPYATLEPLKAVLPLRHGDKMLAKDSTAVGGIKPSGMENRMRGRWQYVGRMWDSNKATANTLSSLERLDFYGNLTTQIEWQHNRDDRPLRVVYGQSGVPTAALLSDPIEIVDYKLYWIGVRNPPEAHYVLSIINSDCLYNAVMPLMPKGQFGARDLMKHLWKLPIPEYDEGVPLHRNLASAGEAAAAGVQVELAKLREERGDKLTVTIARREIRKWLRSSKEGAAVERLVGELLGE